jgi:hypothetical protein
MKLKNILTLAFVIILFSASSVFGQISKSQLSGQANVISTAVSFLTISPDSRGSGMGDLGAATTPDVYSMYWNPAKYSFIEKEFGVAGSVTPWLRKLVNDINLYNIGGFMKLSNNQVVAVSLRDFSLGEIQFTDDNGAFMKTGKPYELAVDLAYSRLFGEHFSGAMAARYIRSDISSGVSISGVETYPANAFAVDVAAYYTNKVQLSDKNGKWAAGVNVSNIGNKVNYTDGSEKDFLPTNLRIGTSLTVDMDEYNSLTGSVDLNKLLVPTSPYVDPVTKDTIGKESNVGVVKGIFQSFSDAPGGYKEELHEIMYSVGAEYWYRKQFALRTGYFHEHETKGNRKYLTIGLGLRMNVFGLDFSYLIAQNNNNALANTMRFSILFNFDQQKKSNKVSR